MSMCASEAKILATQYAISRQETDYTQAILQIDRKIKDACICGYSNVLGIVVNGDGIVLDKVKLYYEELGYACTINHKWEINISW